MYCCMSSFFPFFVLFVCLKCSCMIDDNIVTVFFMLLFQLNFTFATLLIDLFVCNFYFFTLDDWLFCFSSFDFDPLHKMHLDKCGNLLNISQLLTNRTKFRFHEMKKKNTHTIFGVFIVKLHTLSNCGFCTAKSRTQISLYYEHLIENVLPCMHFTDDLLHEIQYN